MLFGIEREADQPSYASVAPRVTRLLPILILVLLAPTVAELLGGATQISQLAYVVFLIPMYGGGALLVRDLVRRRVTPGWWRIGVLGIAFGLVEEGFALQGLFNPDLYGSAGSWGGRFLGINGVYAEVNLGLHAIWSIALPILIIDLLFPRQRCRPWLGTAGLIVTALVYTLGVLLVFVATFGQTLFVAAPAQLAGTFVVAVVLGVGALLWPTSSRHVDTLGSAPPPWQAALAGAVGTVVFIGPLLLLGRSGLARVLGLWAWAPMVGTLAAAGVCGWLIWHWSQRRNWGVRHLWALASGAIVAHTVIGDIAFGRPGLDMIGRFLLVATSVGALWWLGNRSGPRDERSARRLRVD